MQSFIAYLHDLPDEIRNEMFMRRFLGRMDSRQEMRGHGLDMSQWESRSSTPEEVIQKSHGEIDGVIRDELYWWLHYHKLQDIYTCVKGELNLFLKNVSTKTRILAKSTLCPFRR